jgi:hypothetical protein
VQIQTQLVFMFNIRVVKIIFISKLTEIVLSNPENNDSGVKNLASEINMSPSGLNIRLQTPQTYTLPGLQKKEDKKFKYVILVSIN